MSEMRIAAQYQELFSRWLRRSSSSSLSGRCCSRLCSLPFGSLLSRLLLSRLSSLDAHGSLARPGLRECCCRRIARKAGNLPAASCRGLTWLAAVGSHAACGWELEVSEVKSWRCSARAAVMLVRGLCFQRRAPSPSLLPKQPVLSGLAVTAHTDVPSINDGPSRPSRRFTRTCLVEAPTLPPTSRCGQQPRRPSARRRPQLYRRRTTCLLHAVAPSAAARPRGSPCSWAAVVEALGCAVLPQAQPSPRLCRRASPSARPSSRRAVLVTRLTTSRPSSPDEQDESPPPRHSALRPRASAMPSRQRRRGPSAASESQQLVACRAASPAQQPSRAAPHRQDVLLQPSGPASFLPLGYPSLRPAGAHQRGCAVAHEPRWQLEAATSRSCSPATTSSLLSATPALVPPRSLVYLLPPAHAPLVHLRGRGASHQPSPARPAHQPAERNHLPTHTTTVPDSRVEDPTLGETTVEGGDGERRWMRRWGMEREMSGV